MARRRTIYACTHCGAQQPRWLGRCPECQTWDSLVEEAARPDPTDGESLSGEARDLLEVEGAAGSAKPRRLGEIESRNTPRLSSGVAELDRVLGGGGQGYAGPPGGGGQGLAGPQTGGFVPGSVVLLGGEPGVGKSTLALQVAALVQSRGEPGAPGGALYISGEESPAQIRLRADRLPASASTDAVQVLAETRVESFAEPWRDCAPSLVVIDSVQTMRTQRIESAPGSVAQVRESAALLAATAKLHGTVLLLVGHVTKDGSLAGPRVLEHLVDVVLGFEGDRNHAFRLLRASKNRFGSTQEVGVFSMGEAGLQGVANPSELFLAERARDAPGSCIIPLVEGTRPMLVEVQALVAPATYGTPRRTTIGIEDGRVALILAVLDRRSDVDLLSRDVYVNVVGGVRVSEPAADLALALAIVSSALDLPLPPDAAACGEVGLGGEVRRVAQLGPRIREAARLGFRRVLVPRGVGAALRGIEGCESIEVADVAEAVSWLRGSRAESASPRSSKRA
ncbi:MAG: DNA repair protein RadA [Deltaproteobacteria bacterium]|nr:DNA repair protein RadA [Deltaproteobacteria bacterium]MBW2418653.1 DNA repair protein RadA [Deltaproteobacteria bacterium]